MPFSRNPKSKALEAYTENGFYLGKVSTMGDLISEEVANDGGPGSGNFGHKGRPGKVGGSAPRKEGGKELNPKSSSEEKPKSSSEEKPKTRFPGFSEKMKRRYEILELREEEDRAKTELDRALYGGSEPDMKAATVASKKIAEIKNKIDELQEENTEKGPFGRPEWGSKEESEMISGLEKAGGITFWKRDKPSKDDWEREESSALAFGDPEKLYGLYFSKISEKTDWLDQLDSLRFHSTTKEEAGFLKWVMENVEGEDVLDKEYGFIYGDYPKEWKQYYLSLLSKATGGGYYIHHVNQGHNIAPTSSILDVYKGDTKTVYADPPKDVKTLSNYESQAADYRKKLLDMGVSEKGIKEAEAVLTKIFDKNEYAMRIEPEFLARALEGHFMNQFETKSSKGWYNPSVRQKASRILFGTNKDEMNPEDYEKYGYLAQNATGEGSGAYGYGGCTVTFDKKRMAGRVTYTLYDSLSIDDEDNTAGSVSLGGGVTLGGIPEFITPRKMIKALKELPESKYGNMRSVLQAISAPYLELQFHGPLTIDDVASIHYPSKTDMEENLPESMLKTLKDKGVRVYYDMKDGVMSA